MPQIDHMWMPLVRPFCYCLICGGAFLGSGLYLILHWLPSKAADQKLRLEPLCYRVSHLLIIIGIVALVCPIIAHFSLSIIYFIETR